MGVRGFRALRRTGGGTARRFRNRTQVLHAVLEHGVRSIPMPKANPEYFSGSILLAFNTFGSTMPQPMISEPSRALADVAALAAEVARHVDLGRRFGEGSTTGACGSGLLAEDLLGEVEQRLPAFHVGERDALVDVKSFDLVEDAVRAVRNGLVAEHAARADDADGRFLTRSIVRTWIDEVCVRSRMWGPSR